MTNFAGGEIFAAGVAAAFTLLCARRGTAMHSLAGGLYGY